MPQTIVVRYTTKRESAEENEALIRAVFSELAAQNPAGLTYTAVRLDDGVSFVHLATMEGKANPLDEMASFKAFTAGIAQRCVKGPEAGPATVVGAYRHI